MYLDAFFNQYEDFLTQLKKVFPEDPDWNVYLSGLAIFRRTNPTMIVQKTWEFVSRFEEMIQKRDETFFMKRDYSDVSEGEPIEQTVQKLKTMWSTLSVENKQIVWQFVGNITKLAKVCNEAWMIEERVSRFYELHNNKWFHRMNVCLEIIKTQDKCQKYMLSNYGQCFFYSWNWTGWVETNSSRAFSGVSKLRNKIWFTSAGLHFSCRIGLFSTTKSVRS